MRTVEDLERAVRDLSPEDLRAFRKWFYDFGADLWDRQIERDAAEGRLNGLVEEALAEHRAGRTRPGPRAGAQTR